MARTNEYVCDLLGGDYVLANGKKGNYLNEISGKTSTRTVTLVYSAPGATTPTATAAKTTTTLAAATSTQKNGAVPVTAEFSTPIIYYPLGLLWLLL
jgi:hypothetical protein